MDRRNLDFPDLARTGREDRVVLYCESTGWVEKMPPECRDLGPKCKSCGLFDMAYIRYEEATEIDAVDAWIKRFCDSRLTR